MGKKEKRVVKKRNEKETGNQEDQCLRTFRRD